MPCLKTLAVSSAVQIWHVVPQDKGVARRSDTPTGASAFKLWRLGTFLDARLRRVFQITRLHRCAVMG